MQENAALAAWREMPFDFWQARRKVASNSHFGLKPRHFGMDAEIQAMDGN
jgi:hypothetical protein